MSKLNYLVLITLLAVACQTKQAHEHKQHLTSPTKTTLAIPDKIILKVNGKWISEQRLRFYEWGKIPEADRAEYWLVKYPWVKSFAQQKLKYKQRFQIHINEDTTQVKLTFAKENYATVFLQPKGDTTLRHYKKGSIDKFYKLPLAEGLDLTID